MNSENKVGNRTDAENLVRLWNLFFNRTVAYSFDHPFVQECIPRLYESFQKQLQGGGFSILLQELGYYIGAVDIAYQPNNRRIADHLRRFGLDSLSFLPPMGLEEFTKFLDACTLTHADPASFLRYLGAQGLAGVTVNDVTLQTVKEGQVVGAAEGGMAAGAIGAAAPTSPKDSFEDIAMKVVLGHITAKEMSANLSLLQLLEAPENVTNAMLQLTSQARPGEEAASLQRSLLNVMGAFKADAQREGGSIEDVLMGMYSMRGELLKALKAQRNLSQGAVATQMVETANEAFDQTAAQLIVAEYKKTGGNAKRLAQVIQRIVPDRQQLARVLPLIRRELGKIGVPLVEYFGLLGELNQAFSANQNYHELLGAAESVGISGEEMLKELGENPKQAAQLIVLASEMRRVGKQGAVEELIKSLGEYAERAGEALAKTAADKPGDVPRLTSLLHQLDTALQQEIQGRDLSPEAKAVGQQKLRLRMQQSLSDIKGKAALAQLRNPALSADEKAQFLLEVFTDEKDMEDILGLLRGEGGEERLAKDVAEGVMAKVRHELAVRREKAMSKELPGGVYVKAVLDFFIKFEISRANRYGLPFSALLVSFHGLPEDKTIQEKHGDSLRGLQNILIGDLRKAIRESDFIGYLGFNRFLVVMPMTKAEDLDRIIRKLQDNLNRQVALPDGARAWIKPRCGAASFKKDEANTYQKLYAALVKSWQGAAP